ncbi:MAG: hypothetical protein ABL929_12790 [Ferruginibacter sp.]|nr:hypothetical protein [Ferruginibacter sp.]
MRSILSFIFIYFGIIVITACNKNATGMPEPQGGLLPTNYIFIKDATFSPTNITAVNGSSFTFVNQSGSSKGLYSSDSVIINKQGIADNTSYFFKKDTVGTIYYRMAGKPTVVGSITLTP